MTQGNTSGVHVWLVLWKATAAVRARAEESIAAMNLCLTDFAILEILLHKGALPVNRIGQKLFLTSGSISTAIDRIEKRGLAMRKPSSEDGRVTLVDLTDDGRELIERSFRQHELYMEAVMGALNSEERTTLLPLLRKMGRFADGLSRR
jgi:MarR family 2-MHQ and catechol resistance regulon transcriptional repressor